MRPSRTAVAIALALAALAAAGCGLGPGDDVGDVSLTVTRDYGTEPVVEPVGEGIAESDTVMRVLERNAEIATRYGGGFVQAIDGLEAERSDGRSWDWFFYVNGVESTVGAADYELDDGEAVWWDYRDWSTAMRAPAVVGSWPQPFAGGYEGRSHPTAVECLGAEAGTCALVRRRLRVAGASLVDDGARGAIRVLVGPWARLRDDPAAAQIEAGPQQSGVFAEFSPRSAGFELVGLDEGGVETRRFGPGAGLVAATRRYDSPPLWIVSGTTATGVAAAAALLDAAALRDHYAVATEGGAPVPLPLG